MTDVRMSGNLPVVRPRSTGFNFSDVNHLQPQHSQLRYSQTSTQLDPRYQQSSSNQSSSINNSQSHTQIDPRYQQQIDPRYQQNQSTQQNQQFLRKQSQQEIMYVKPTPQYNPQIQQKQQIQQQIQQKQGTQTPRVATQYQQQIDPRYQQSQINNIQGGKKKGGKQVVEEVIEEESEEEEEEEEVSEESEEESKDPDDLFLTEYEKKMKLTYDADKLKALEKILNETRRYGIKPANP